MFGLLLWLCLLFKGAGQLRVFFKNMEPVRFLTGWLALCLKEGTSQQLGLHREVT